MQATTPPASPQDSFSGLAGIPGSPPIPFSRAWTRLRTREITPYLWVQPDESGEPRLTVS